MKHPAVDRPLVAIVPCRNEAPSISSVLKELARIGVGRVIVAVDPRSTDTTATLAAEAGAQVVHSHTSGYDGPCLAGIKTLSDEGFDGDVLFLDAGNKYEMDSVAALLDGLDPSADITFGIRDAQMKWHQRIGNNVFRMVLFLRFRRWVHDVSSLRVVRMPVIAELQLQDRQYSLPFQTIVHALALDKHICYVPIHCTPMRTGVSKVSGEWRNSAKAAQQMLISVARVPRL